MLKNLHSSKVIDIYISYLVQLYQSFNTLLEKNVFGNFIL